MTCKRVTTPKADLWGPHRRRSRTHRECAVEMWTGFPCFTRAVRKNPLFLSAGGPHASEVQSRIQNLLLVLGVVKNLRICPPSTRRHWPATPIPRPPPAPSARAARLPSILPFSLPSSFSALPWSPPNSFCPLRPLIYPPNLQICGLLLACFPKTSLPSRWRATTPSRSCLPTTSPAPSRSCKPSVLWLTLTSRWVGRRVMKLLLLMPAMKMMTMMMTGMRTVTLRRAKRKSRKGRSMTILRPVTPRRNK